MAVVLLSSGLTLGAGGCGSPPIGSPFSPIPPPEPTFGPGTPELDSKGVRHLYWTVTSPPVARLSNIWVYVDNDNLGAGVSLRASADGSYATRIEGQEGDRILFGFGAAFVDSELRLCRLLYAGLANTPCR
jgi:hypothetical protein